MKAITEQLRHRNVSEVLKKEKASPPTILPEESLSDPLAAAELASTQQQSSLESASIAQAYEETLEFYIEQKHEQVGRIESRLEDLIDRQEAKLNHAQSHSPGFLSSAGKRKNWEMQLTLCRAKLEALRSKLDDVKEIKSSMGLFTPKIEELATRRMRIEHPELASSWDAMKNQERKENITHSTANIKTRSRKHRLSLFDS